MVFRESEFLIKNQEFKTTHKLPKMNSNVLPQNI